MTLFFERRENVDAVSEGLEGLIFPLAAITKVCVAGSSHVFSSDVVV